MLPIHFFTYFKEPQTTPGLKSHIFTMTPFPFLKHVSPNDSRCGVKGNVSRDYRHLFFHGSNILTCFSGALIGSNNEKKI